jgi:hypothetical protein
MKMEEESALARAKIKAMALHVLDVCVGVKFHPPPPSGAFGVGVGGKMGMMWLNGNG